MSTTTKPIPFKLSQPKKRTSRHSLKDATQLNTFVFGSSTSVSVVGRGSTTTTSSSQNKSMRRSLTEPRPFRFRTEERAADTTSTTTAKEETPVSLTVEESV